MEILVLMSAIILVSFVLGMFVAVKLGKHFTDNYVEKMSPKKLREIGNMDRDDKPYEPSDEALWARDMSSDDVDSFYDNNSKQEVV